MPRRFTPLDLIDGWSGKIAGTFRIAEVRATRNDAGGARVQLCLPGSADEPEPLTGTGRRDQP